MLFASTIGQIGHPFYVLFAWLLAAIYSGIPNYAIAIALLTLIVMVIAFPITLKQTRGMMKMQLLSPEMKKIQARYKATPGMSVQERQESRRALNEEMMALYKENNTSPTSSCLPLLLQMPIFLILYGTIRGLTHITTVTRNGKVISRTPTPLYISHTSRLYHSIINAGGALHAFGINLADSVKSSSLSWGAKTPYIALILVAVGLQYLQMRQLAGRNPAARQANPQMQQMQKIMPLMFAVIYISIPAGVNVYFIVSSMFRVVQQDLMYRRDPQLQASVSELRARHATGRVVDVKANGQPAAAGGLLGRLRNASALQADPGDEARPASYTPPREMVDPKSSGAKQNGAKPQQNGARQNGAKQNGAKQNGNREAPKATRSTSKRQRRPR